MERRFIYFILIAATVLCSFKAVSQKDTLMWFTGKWKDKKTFQIQTNMSGGRSTGGGGGGTVVIQSDGTLKVSTPENQKWNDKIDEQVKEIDQTEEDVKTTMHLGQNMLQYNLGKESINELEKVKEEIKGYKAEPVKEDNANSHTNAQKFASAVNSWCVQAQADSKEVIDFYQAHRKDKNFNLPAPPAADYTCWSCDKNKREEYENKSKKYADSFFKEERSLIKKALSICRTITLIGKGEDTGSIVTDDNLDNSMGKAFSHNSKDPSKNGPCYGLDESKLWDAVKGLVLRGVDKANQLLNENKKNYAVLNPVIRVYLNAHRDAHLLGLAMEDDLASLGSISYDFYNQQKNKLIKEKDYSQIANIPFMLGLLREAALLGANMNDGNEINELLSFCHFKISLEMDIKVGKNSGYMLAHLKGSAKVIPELDSLKCVIFSLDKDEKSVIRLDLISNEFSAPGTHPVYIGTRQAETPMPNIDIHFCKQGNDSIYIIRFVPFNKGSMMWQVPGAQPYAGWINGLDGYFSDYKEMVRDAYDLKNNPEKIAESKQKAIELKQKVLALQQSGASPEQMAAEMKKMIEAGNQLMETPVFKFTELKFPVHLQSGSETLFNEKYDAKQINPKAAPAIIYGYFTVKLEHDKKN